MVNRFFIREEQEEPSQPDGSDVDENDLNENDLDEIAVEAADQAHIDFDDMDTHHSVRVKSVVARDIQAKDTLAEPASVASSSVKANPAVALNTAVDVGTLELPTTSEPVLSYLDERVLWSGSPSQWLNFGRYFFWGIVWLGGLTATYHGWYHQYAVIYPEFEIYLYVLAGVAIMLPPMMIFGWFLKLKMHRVVISYNKITESTGFTDIFRSEQFCELSDVKDIIAPPAGWMALVRRGDLVFHTMDSDQSVIHIRAMKGRHQVKQQLIPLIRRLRVERRGVYTAG